MTKGNTSAYFINSHNLYHRLLKSRLPNGFDKKAPSAKVIFKLTDNWKIKDFSVRELMKFFFQSHHFHCRLLKLNIQMGSQKE